MRPFMLEVISSEHIKLIFETNKNIILRQIYPVYSITHVKI